MNKKPFELLDQIAQEISTAGKYAKTIARESTDNNEIFMLAYCFISAGYHQAILTDLMGDDPDAIAQLTSGFQSLPAQFDQQIFSAIAAKCNHFEVFRNALRNPDEAKGDKVKSFHISNECMTYISLVFNIPVAEITQIMNKKCILSVVFLALLEKASEMERYGELDNLKNTVEAKQLRRALDINKSPEFRDIFSGKMS